MEGRRGPGQGSSQPGRGAAESAEEAARCDSSSATWQTQAASAAAWLSRPATPRLVLEPGAAGESGEGAGTVCELGIGSAGRLREAVPQLAKVGLLERKRLARFVSESGADGVDVGLVNRRDR